MARRYKSSTGRRARSYSRYTPANPRTHKGNRVVRPETPAISERFPDRRISRRVESSEGFANSRIYRDELQARHRNRRSAMSKPREAAKRGLPAALMPLRRPDENAPNNQATRSVCTRKKATRRAVIIATGHGGINNARKYKKHRKC